MEKNDQQPPTPAQPEATPIAVKTPKVEKGREVSIVLADGTLSPATITKVHNKELVDVEFDYRGETVEITKSPFDAERKKADSWNSP